MPLGEPPKIDSLEELEVRLDFFNWANNDRLRQPYPLRTKDFDNLRIRGNRGVLSSKTFFP
jgi:hypothetical protein